MTVQGGISVDAKPYALQYRGLALEFIQLTRDLVKLPEDAGEGFRFLSDDCVLRRLESMFPEEVFLQDVVHAVEMALVDAAKTDYWYSHLESDYLDESEFDDCDEFWGDAGC